MSQFPSIPAGATLTAALLTSMEPLIAYKPSDTSRATNTTLANDPDLVLPVVSNATYFFVLFIDYEGGTLGSSDIKVAWTVPASCTMRYARIGQDPSGNPFSALVVTEGTTTAAGSAGAAALRGLTFIGSITVSSTAGNVQLQWAQNTSSGTATIVHAQSTMILLRHS